jgi:hypothetical protein
VHEEFVGVGHSILKELEQRDLEMLQKYKSRAAKESSPAAIIPVDAIVHAFVILIKSLL